jgi:hypothetical protein
MSWVAAYLQVEQHSVPGDRISHKRVLEHIPHGQCIPRV